MSRRSSAKAVGTSFAALIVSIWFTGFMFYRAKPRALGGVPTVVETSSIEPPMCGQLDDKLVHVPPDWSTFVPPRKGDSYVDPVFKCKITRLTDSSSEEETWDGTHPSFTHYYSTLSPMNSTDTMLLIGSNDGAVRVKGMDGRTVIPRTKMPAMSGHPVWDAADGNVFYYTSGKTLHQATIKGNTVKETAVHTFGEYRGIVSPDAADLSEDGDHIALVGQNSNNTMDIFVWSLHKEAKTSSYTTTCTINGEVNETSQPGCIHKLLLTADNLLAIAFANNGQEPEQGMRLWDGSRLVHLQDGTNHADTGYDLAGNPIFIASNNAGSLEGIKNPCSSGWGVDVRRENDLSSAVCLLDHQPGWHVSYRGSVSQPWVALSFFDKRKKGPELYSNSENFIRPSSSNWLLYEDEIILAHIDGKAIYRLGHARSRSGEGYWQEPHAAINRDGKYVVFTSSMAYPNGCPTKMHVPNECTDVYFIKVN